MIKILLLTLLIAVSQSGIVFANKKTTKNISNRFSNIQSTKHYKRTVKGYKYAAYPLTVKNNQPIKIHLKTKSTNLSVAILGTGDSAGYDNIENGTFNITDWEGKLPEGTYEIRVLLNRNAARKNLSASFQLSITQ